MNYLSTGKTQVKSDKYCVLYDPASGVIRHVHRVVTMDGAEETPQLVVEQRALKLAADFGLDVKRVQPLHVDAAQVEPGRQYKVDVKSRRLTAIEKKAPRKKSPAAKAGPRKK